MLASLTAMSSASRWSIPPSLRWQPSWSCRCGYGVLYGWFVVAIPAVILVVLIVAPPCRCSYGSPLRMVLCFIPAVILSRPHRGPAGHRDERASLMPPTMLGVTRTGCSLHGLGLRRRGDRRVWPSVRPDMWFVSMRTLLLGPPACRCRHARFLCGPPRVGIVAWCLLWCEWWCGWYWVRFRGLRLRVVEGLLRVWRMSGILIIRWQP